ncbi:hypothetical protein B0H14DRAFT_2611975 [Mycena olivaceomarginata]|nr:hypothetical protein B0H14DRAFT_2611975 [Mycena olivaceomarginata]
MDFPPTGLPSTAPPTPRTGSRRRRTAPTRSSSLSASELNISAPLIDVYNTILDFRAYPSWNTFVFAVDLPSNVTTTPTDDYVGMPMMFHTAGVLPFFNTTSNEVLTVLDYANAAGYSLSAWRL